MKMPENWNGLKTETDLDYAAQSLGFTLTIDTIHVVYELRPKKGYWRYLSEGNLSLTGSRPLITAFLLGFSCMREEHHIRHNEFTQGVLKLVYPHGVPENEKT